MTGAWPKIAKAPPGRAGSKIPKKTGAFLQTGKGRLVKGGLRTRRMTAVCRRTVQARPGRVGSKTRQEINVFATTVRKIQAKSVETWLKPG